jgi:hypothetical protein
MACPTCDHTMQSLSEWVCWCPRCGTIKDPSGTTKPKIGDRVKKFCLLLSKDNHDDALSMAALRNLGVYECLYVPEQRP